MNFVPSLRVEIREHVGHVTFERSEAGNSIHLQFGKEFLAAAHRIESTPGVRAVLMTGAGRNFCFGGDLRAMFATEQDIHLYLSELTTDLHAGMTIFAGLDAPVIAAVNAGLEGQLQRESESIASRGATPEGSEGIAAFLDKRPPRYL